MRLHPFVLGLLVLASCTRRPAARDAGDEPPLLDAGAADTSEGDVAWRRMRPRSTACIDVDLGEALGQGLGMTRIDALDDDVPRALCSTDLYRICNGILPGELGLLFRATEGGFYEFRARGTSVSNLGIDIATFADMDSVACRDRSDVSSMVEVGFGEVPTDVGWFCSCEYVSPGAGRTWSTAPLRTTEALAAGTLVLLTVEANATGEDAEVGVDVRRVESCDNGVDDDGDGDVDCRDDDCPFSNYGEPTSVCDERRSCAMPSPDTDCCANGVDDDEDGESDCVDQQCSGAPGCTPELVCDDGLDDDADLRVDCADADCRYAEPCFDATPGETVCDDAVDDDGDELVDCGDPDCVYPGSACFGPYEVAYLGECVDGLDNDADGRSDCADVDCRRDAFTCPDVESNCVDGRDDDFDEAVDCGDPDCAYAADCIETQCDDAVDDDGDGRADCADLDCACYGDCPCG